MALETRVWRTGFESNLLTTVPKAVRVQLGLAPTDKLRWSVEGGYARVTKAEVVAEGEAGAYRLYKQTRGNSLYTALPAAVVEQLRMNDRSRVEWELQGGAAHVRRA
jgi:antitoxin component of MazEF toxin-antitoxin module